MDLEAKQKPQIITCLNCQSLNDENNNFQNSLCTNCKNEKENERMIIVPDTSSDDEEYWCSSINDSQSISLDTRKIWHDIAHIIKCIYRETNREFTENHSTTDICKVKEYVQILTQLDPECLFNKIESIVLEYVNEIRNQVLKRFQTCLKTSNDVQLFISYLLDEYNTFIQAAKNVSIIVSYLEEHYMKSFHLTWLLYNKHLYEKLVYMDKKIQHSMSTMIDLLQPTNDNNNNYSPAEYTQLLNRFLTFDEEMSEIACLYKDCQIKMASISRNFLIKNRNQMGIIVKTKTKKISKKTKRIKNTTGLTKDNLNNSTTNSVNIPLTNNSLIIPLTLQQDLNSSSIGSGIGDKESSSISSFDDYLIDNNTSSSSYTKEESNHLIQNNNHEQLFDEIITNNSSFTQIQCDNKEQQNVISNVISTKKSKSNRRKENSTINLNSSSTILSKVSSTSDLILPPKPPSSIGSKLQADFRPLTIPLLNKTEISTCPSLLSAKIQSVSFTAGTFGSITTNESLNNQKRLNINLSRKLNSSIKSDSTMTFNNFDQFIRQTTPSNEMSELLSSKSSLSDKNSDFCCCDLLPESNPCLSCMSLPNSTTITCAFNQRDAEMKERLKLKLTKRIVQNTSDESKLLTEENKSKIKSCDNNIDDLVKFIDGNETTTTSDKIRNKKTKKKKDKQQSKINLLNEDTKQNQSISKDLINDISQPLSKRKQKAKLKLEKQDDESSTIKPSTSPIVTPVALSLPEKSDSIQTNIEPSSETSIPPEEEINWITISRKQSKHKPIPASVPSLLTTPTIPSNNTKQKRQQTTKNIKISTVAQQKVIPETISNSNKQQHTTTVVPLHAQNSMKNHTSQQQKSEPPSAWTTQVTPSSSTLLATTPAFIPSSSLIKSNKSNDVLPLEEPLSSLYWNPNGYLLPPGPVQRPISSFSPAPGSLNPTISRCIQRPLSEPRTTSFPVYSPMNYTIGDNSTSTWNNTPITNTNESQQWKYPHEEQFQTSIIPSDFPLYDPFNSGAGLPIPSSTLSNNKFEKPFSQDNDIDEMDALDKEIEHFKKSYIDNNPDKSHINIDHRFIYQSK